MATLDLEDWWFTVSLAMASLGAITLSILSGRKRKRLNATYFGVLILTLSAIIVAAGAWAGSWLTWKQRDDAIAKTIARWDPDFIAAQDHGYFTMYEFRNPKTGQMALAQARYQFRYPDFGLTALPSAVGICIVALVIRAITSRFMVRQRLPNGCPTCGYDLTGNESGICPECGDVVEVTA